MFPLSPRPAVHRMRSEANLPEMPKLSRYGSVRVSRSLGNLIQRAPASIPHQLKHAENLPRKSLLVILGDVIGTVKAEEVLQYETHHAILLIWRCQTKPLAL